MNDENKKSILQMARGGFLERVDYEMSKVIDNIMDANTKATGKRKLTVTMELTPDEDRTTITVDFTVKSTPVPTNSIRTVLCVLGNESTGELQITEMAPQIPGQYSMDGQEQEAPPSLKIIKFA